MPIGVLDKGREKTTLVLDTWANVSDEELRAHWDCELTVDETQLLAKLAESLGYLGRSESWVDVRLIEDQGLTLTGLNAFPHHTGMAPGRDWEQVSLMAAMQPVDYTRWRDDRVSSALADLPLPLTKKKLPAKLVKARDDAIAPYPTDLLDSLMKDVAWWKRHRWSQPPGSQRVLYWRKLDSLQVAPPQRSKCKKLQPVTTMLLALTTPSGSRSALPPCSRTLPQAELFHRAIVGRAGMGEEVDCPELTGRNAQGIPLRSGHRHAHVLPVDLDGDGHLDHLIIHAPMGLRDVAQRAIRSLRRTWTKKGVGELQVALAGSGELDSLRSMTPPTIAQRIMRLLGPPGGAPVWETATPFVPPRFLKRQGPNSLEGQIHAELASRGLPPPEHVEVLGNSPGVASLRHYVRRRLHGGAPPPADIGFALRLRFASPVLGPIVLGYASHFGLGLFSACNDVPSAPPLRRT